MEIEITHVNKEQGEHAQYITHYGWSSAGGNLCTPKAAFIAILRKHEARAYVGSGSDKVYCLIKGDLGGEYLQTDPDGKHDNNLLSLPPCTPTS